MFVSWQQESTHENLIDQDNEEENTDEDDDDDNDECVGDRQLSSSSSSIKANNPNEQACLQSKQENKSLFDEITAITDDSTKCSPSLKLRFNASDNEQKENQF